MTTVAAARLEARERLSAIAHEPQLEADLLLGHALGWSRSRLFSESDRRLSTAERTTLKRLTKERMSGRPIAYVLGEKSWFGFHLYVDGSVLVPRPETELLVERAIELATEVKSKRIADIGTGCGAIAVGLASRLSSVEIDAGDISEAALAVARRNLLLLGRAAAPVRFFIGDLIAPLEHVPDLIVANLPYLASSDWVSLGPEVRSEPPEALIGGPTGTELIRRLLNEVHRRGWQPHFVLEIGHDQGKALSDAARDAFPAARAQVEKDYAGCDRILVIRQPDEA